eukprot:Partr_v1_DN28533_c2_g1_i2_m73753 putative Plays a key role in early steps of protein N-linked glycosylation by being required for the conversion of polyprenol into dolichol. Dolichols are required for the synthesis of dolichol-linked monosaccharides and the oligosaccharide precursor used for N-glycosylation. Acts as a polyprenol reductase that promotes the reduction of the alpha-isoprene unit of polyprenols into dolichols in a NADP-dependent mechanism
MVETWIIAMFYLGITAAAVIAYVVPSLRDTLIGHGKLSPAMDTDASAVLIRVLRAVGVTSRVPKRWFTHFYAWGVVWNGCLLLLVESRGGVSWSQAVMQVHLTRRFLESACMQVYSDASEMLVGHYVLGLLFYTVTCFALALESRVDPLSGGVAVFIFLAASVGQFQCHRELAAVRLRSSSKYQLMRTSWFKYVTCPHYTFEILIYVSLAVMSRSVSMVWCLVWVIVNLSILAVESRRWYRRRFPDDSQFISGRACLFPGVL